MAILEIEISAELLEAASRLALRHYGNTEGPSIIRVGEAAILMRLFWLNLLETAGQEVEEPVVEWRAEDHETPSQGKDQVREWLFGGR